MDRLLPTVKYSTPPAAEFGRELAQEVIDKVSPRLGGLVIAKMILEQQGWRLGYSQTIPESSTIQSLLIPLLGGGFTVAINPTHLPDDPKQRLHHEAFLISHEIAHSFFYTEKPGGRPPQRIIRGLATQAEEKFCDEFGKPFSEW